jgi:phosphopentomutase
MRFKRIFLTVLDSFGIGELPDATNFGDEGSNTLRSVYGTGKLKIPNMKKLGLYNIPEVRVGEAEAKPIGAYGRAAEGSAGKDTTVGHWEIMGVVSDKPLPTYPQGFPIELLDKLTAITGIGWLCNKPYSGTDVLRDYGREHEITKKMIVYTSADSVFQVAANMSVYTLDQLYSYCEAARMLMKDEHSVGRVIARPFVGEYPNYERTSDRHDYSLPCPKNTALDSLVRGGYDVISVGKINDIFASRGITSSFRATSNSAGMDKTYSLLQDNITGLIFTNLVDFDSKYGHRNDPEGYAEALNRYDEWLGGFIPKMRDDDLLIITADHGCDPITPSTDHSREYVPILVYAKGIQPVCLGTRSTFTDIAATVCENFGVDRVGKGVSFLKSIFVGDPQGLIDAADRAMKNSYAPYSSYNVGAALICRDGRVFSGSNVESAAFSPTSCAERTALTKAVSEGAKGFDAIAVVGGKNGTVEGGCTPCGVCRQLLYELGGKDMLVFNLDRDKKIICRRMEELLPDGFSGSSFVNLE